MSATPRNANAINGQSGAGMVHMHIGVNRGAWLQIAAALDKQPHRDLFDHARRVGALEAQRVEGPRASGEDAARVASAAINFGGCVAPETSVPDGNHGDNFAKGVL